MQLSENLGGEAVPSPQDPQEKAKAPRSGEFGILNFKCQIPPPGDHSALDPPVPIPNTAVKRCSANGIRAIGPVRVGRCQIL